MLNTRRQRLRFTLLAIFAAGVFLPFLGRRDIVTSHEARVAQVARQMADVGWPWQARSVEVPNVELVDTPQGKRLKARRDGSTLRVNPWIVPVLNGEVRLQKPPLPYWCAALLFRVLGVGEAEVRFFPALLGAVATILIWDLARQHIGRLGGWLAAGVWLSSYFIVDEYRKAMADPYLAFCTLLTLWSWVRASRASRPAGWIIVFYTALAFGFLAKGPVILVFLAVFLPLYQACYRRPFPKRWHVHLNGVPLFILIAAPWYLDVWLSIPHAISLWRYESIGEINDNVEKARAWWFYFPGLFQISLPWTPLWVLGMVLPLIRPQRRRLFAPASIVLIVLVFSLLHVKKNAYLLPLMPAQTIVIVQGIQWLMAMLRQLPKLRKIAKLPTLVTALALFFGVAVQIFINGILAPRENKRSPRYVAGVVQKLLDGSAERSLLVSGLAEEASFYLPLNLPDAKPGSSEVLLIADDRQGLAEKTAHAMAVLQAPRVASVKAIPLPVDKTTRWKLFDLHLGDPADLPRPSPAARP